MEQTSALESSGVVLHTSYRKVCVVQLGGEPQREDIEWFRCRIRGCKKKQSALGAWWSHPGRSFNLKQQPADIKCLHTS